MSSAVFFFKQSNKYWPLVYIHVQCFFMSTAKMLFDVSLLSQECFVEGMAACQPSSFANLFILSNPQVLTTNMKPVTYQLNYEHC